LPDVTKVIAVYDAALNCLMLAYKQNKNIYYILALKQNLLVVFLKNIITVML